MRRRELLALVAGATAFQPLTGAAQRKEMPVIGFLDVTRADVFFLDPFRQGLRETSYVEGNNVAMEFPAANWRVHYELLPALAADLVSHKVDMIVTSAGTNAALAAKGATTTIPIVFTFVGDPVGVGLIASLARPGGNLTGFSNIAGELAPKQLDLILELVPKASVIALLVNPKNPAGELLIRNMVEAVRVKSVQLAVQKAGIEDEIDAAFAALVQQPVAALVVDPDGFFNSRRKQIASLASRHAIPAIYGHPSFTAAGGLMSYGIDETFVSRQAGIYAGRILKGAKPADLPVQQPTKFELSINLKTAKALGLTVPQSFLQRADEVIE
jgi:putative ABC transport system substrate-binding protein